MLCNVVASWKTHWFLLSTWLERSNVASTYFSGRAIYQLLSYFRTFDCKSIILFICLFIFYLYCLFLWFCYPSPYFLKGWACKYSTIRQLTCCTDTEVEICWTATQKKAYILFTYSLSLSSRQVSFPPLFMLIDAKDNLWRDPVLHTTVAEDWSHGVCWTLWVKWCHI